METEFLLVVTGISIDDDEAVTTLAEDFDAVLSFNRDTYRLALSAEGIDPVNALSTLLVRLAEAVPSLQLLRLDPDLVGVADIADRTDRSRQNVQQWIDGSRHNDAGPFPASEGTAGRSLVWRWSDVYAWLRPQGLVEDERMPSRTEALLMDLVLLQWQQSRAQGTPLFRTMCPGNDDRAEDRLRVAQAVNQSLSNPHFMAALTAVPRANKHQVTVVSAVLLDRLDFIVQNLGGDVSGVIAVQTSDDQLRYLPIASIELPGSIPVSSLGLSEDATVGDLVLALDENLVGPSTPLLLP